MKRVKFQPSINVLERPRRREEKGVDKGQEKPEAKKYAPIVSVKSIIYSLIRDDSVKL